MKVLLFLVLVATAGLSYFEVTMQQQTSDGFAQQEDSWKGPLEKLQAENKDLVATQGYLTENVAAAEKQVAALTEQLSHPKSTNPAPAPAPNPAPLPPPVPTDSLGTIATPDGRTFQNCQLLKIEPDGITISHSNGINKLSYTDLPPELRKRFSTSAQP